MRFRYGRILPLFVACFGAFAQSVPPPDLQSLYAELNERSTTNTAAQQLRDLASKDVAAWDFLAQNLPALISANAKGDWKSLTAPWMNAVRLAGQLKLDTAIPALIDSLSRSPVRGGYDQAALVRTLAQEAKLEFDIVGRALADIGDPAVPAIANVLANGDTRVVRLRAAWMLKNINTPTARKAMSNRLQLETDPGIKNVLASH